MIMPAPSIAVKVRQPVALRVRNMVGARKMPQGRKEAHGDVWDAGLEVVLADLLKVELAVEASEEAEEGDHELRQGGGTSMKNLPLIYLEAKPPKLKSEKG